MADLRLALDAILANVTGGTLDELCALWIAEAPPAGKLVVLPWLAGPRVGDSLISEHTWSHQTVDTGKPRFWSPELPEVVLSYRFPLAPAVALRKLTGASEGEWRPVPVVVRPPEVLSFEGESKPLAVLLPPGVPGSGVSQLVGAFTRRGGRR